MTKQLRTNYLIRRLSILALFGSIAPYLVVAQAPSGTNQPPSSSCRIEATDYKGWHAQQSV